MVINHRIDRFESKTRPLTWEGVGVFFIKDGKIQEWSDYTIRVVAAAASSPSELFRERFPYLTYPTYLTHLTGSILSSCSKASNG